MKKVIYKIENNINDKIYIGSAEKFNLRYNQHKHHLLKGTHHSIILQNFVNKYGFKSLSFKIIEENVVNLIEREQFYIDTLNPFFNIRKIADSMKGTKRTKEQKIYMLEQRLKKSGYPKKKLIEKKERKKRIGIKHSEETKIKISNLRKGNGNGMFNKKGELHPKYGKKVSEETLIKMRCRGGEIIDLNTGIIYINRFEFCEKLNIPKGTACKYLSGKVKSVQNYMYVKKI